MIKSTTLTEKIEQIVSSQSIVWLSDIAVLCRKTKKQVEEAIHLSDKVHLGSLGKYKIKNGQYSYNFPVEITTPENPKPYDENIGGGHFSHGPLRARGIDK